MTGRSLLALLRAAALISPPAGPVSGRENAVTVRVGLQPGAEASVTITVTPDMLATFEELGPVHPLYATWSMVRHMELACRKIILPYLLPDEDAVGHSVSVTHLAATAAGERVTARARLLQIDGRRIVCAVDAYNEHEKIGEGTQVQLLVRRDRLAHRIADLQRRTAQLAEGGR